MTRRAPPKGTTRGKRLIKSQQQPAVAQALLALVASNEPGMRTLLLFRIRRKHHGPSSLLRGMLLVAETYECYIISRLSRQAAAMWALRHNTIRACTTSYSSAEKALAAARTGSIRKCQAAPRLRSPPGPIPFISAPSPGKTIVCCFRDIF